MKKHLSEVRPALRLVVDEGPPPPGMRVWCVSLWGCGFSSHWHPEFGIVAWCPLPAFTAEQNQRLATLQAEGVDVTKLLETEHAHSSNTNNS